MAPYEMMNYLPYLLGIVAVAILAVVILIVCCCRNRRRLRKQKQTDVELQSTDRTRATCDTPIYYVDATDGRYTQSPRISYPTLDLHGKTLKGAMEATKTFITTFKKDYLAHGGSLYVNVIPGRGRHSKDGVPVLKPNVEKYLHQEKLKFHHENRGGQLVVDLGS